MKFKQKDSAIQEILNYVQKLKNSEKAVKLEKVTGYSKEECDKKYLTKEDADGKYQGKAAMVKYALKADLIKTTEKDAGKFLKANSMTEKRTNSFSWVDINEVPTITVKDDGKVLMAHKDKTYGWESLEKELPKITAAEKGKVLTANYNVKQGGFATWSTSPTIPNYEKTPDGSTLVVEKVNGENRLVWANLIPMTSDKEDIGKVLTVSYATSKSKTPNLAWKEIIPDYSKAKEGAVLTVKIIKGEPKLVWE